MTLVSDICSNKTNAGDLVLSQSKLTVHWLYIHVHCSCTHFALSILSILTTLTNLSPPLHTHTHTHNQPNTLVPITMLQLSPAPEEEDYLYHLGEREGVTDLYDLQKSVTSSSQPQRTQLWSPLLLLVQLISHQMHSMPHIRHHFFSFLAELNLTLLILFFTHYCFSKSVIFFHQCLYSFCYHPGNYCHWWLPSCFLVFCQKAKFDGENQVLQSRYIDYAEQLIDVQQYWLCYILCKAICIKSCG